MIQFLLIVHLSEVPVDENLTMLKNMIAFMLYLPIFSCMRFDFSAFSASQVITFALQHIDLILLLVSEIQMYTKEEVWSEIEFSVRIFYVTYSCIMCYGGNVFVVSRYPIERCVRNTS